jgi:hypothetical protein
MSTKDATDNGGETRMDDKDRKPRACIDMDASSDIPRIMPAWDPNLIWDEGGWPIGCIEQADARRPEKAAP